MLPVIKGEPSLILYRFPLISRPVTSYRKGGTTPLRGVRWNILEGRLISQFLIRLLVVT